MALKKKEEGKHEQNISTSSKKIYKSLEKVFVSTLKKVK